MKKIIFLAFISIFLSACGGSGISKSSQGFAPIDNAAFNKAFVGSSVQVGMKEDKTSITIIPEDKFEYKEGGIVTYRGTYSYANKGKNKSESNIVYIQKITHKDGKEHQKEIRTACKLYLTFKSSVYGDVNLVCTNGPLKTTTETTFTFDRLN